MLAVAGNVVPGMPLTQALQSVLLSTGFLFTVLYVAGLVLAIRSRVRLGAAAKVAIWGYGILLAGNVLSAASRVVRLTRDARIVGGDRIIDMDWVYSLSVLQVAASFVGAVLLLIAILKSRTGSGPG